jgi:hypothetical protein
MLLPRFSIRTMLAMLTAVAVVSLFAGRALGGRAWALGLTAAVVSVPVALLVHAGFFAIGSAFGRLLAPEEVVARTSRGGLQRSGETTSCVARSPERDSTIAAP